MAIDTPVLRGVVKRAAATELKLEWYEARPTLTKQESERRRQLETDLKDYLLALGMSARSALLYRPIEERQRAARVRPPVRPRQDPEHVRQVVGVLLASGALGSVGMEIAHERDPEGNGDWVLFTDEEREALTGVAAETEEEEPVEPYEPEVVQLRAVRGDVPYPEVAS